jgi:hypothetical protein
MHLVDSWGLDDAVSFMELTYCEMRQQTRKYCWVITKKVGWKEKKYFTTRTIGLNNLCN